MNRYGHTTEHRQRPRLLHSPPDATKACATCGATDHLGEDGDDTLFCEACKAPLAELAFPEYYCDLGGEA